MNIVEQFLTIAIALYDTQPLSIAFVTTGRSTINSNPISKDYRNTLQRNSRNTNDKKTNKRLQIPRNIELLDLVHFASSIIRWKKTKPDGKISFSRRRIEEQ